MLSTLSRSGNKATYTFGPDGGRPKQYNISSDSSRKQFVTVKVDEQAEKEHQIVGNGTKNEAVLLPIDARQVVFTFNYEADGKKKPSEVQTGGPWVFAGVQVGAIASENGDDVDFNDAVVQILVK